MPKPTIAEFFDSQCDKHGLVGWAASHWDNQDQQLGRFRKLTEGFPYYLACPTVLDVGCGQGDLWRYIAAATSGMSKGESYFGIDVSPRMVAAASEKYPLVKVDVGDVLTYKFDQQYDYVYASGLFGYRDQSVDQLSNAKQTIAKMFELSKRATIFNMMSVCLPEEAKSLPDIDDFGFYDPAEILTFCLQLTPLVKLDHYLPYEFLVCLTRK